MWHPMRSILMRGLDDVLDLLSGQSSTAVCGAEYWAVAWRYARAVHHWGGCRPCGYRISGFPSNVHEKVCQ